MVDGVWVPIVSELLPEHILDRFKQAQSEWYEVLSSSSAEDIKLRILQNATRPSIANLVQDHDLKVVGKFPLKKFYAEGQTEVTQVDWAEYFIEVAMLADMPGSNMLRKVCHKFLEQNKLIQQKDWLEVLPGTCSTGSRDFSP